MENLILIKEAMRKSFINNEYYLLNLCQKLGVKLEKKDNMIFVDYEKLSLFIKNFKLYTYQNIENELKVIIPDSNSLK